MAYWMSDLREIRGVDLKPVPLRMVARALLPDILGGRPVHVSIILDHHFEDQRDLMEFLTVLFVQASTKETETALASDLRREIRRLRYSQAAKGLHGDAVFRPGIADAIRSAVEQSHHEIALTGIL